MIFSFLFIYEKEDSATKYNEIYLIEESNKLIY